MPISGNRPDPRIRRTVVTKLEAAIAESGSRRQGQILFLAGAAGCGRIPTPDRRCQLRRWGLRIPGAGRVRYRCFGCAGQSTGPTGDAAGRSPLVPIVGRIAEAAHGMAVRAQLASAQARALNMLGMTSYGLGEMASALGYYEQALPLQRAVGDRGGEAYTL